MKNHLQHPSIQPQHHQAQTFVLLRCFLKDTINPQAISYCLLLPQLSRQPWLSLHPVIPLGLSYAVCETHTQNGSFSTCLHQKNPVAHCTQSLGECPREPQLSGYGSLDFSFGFSMGLVFLKLCLEILPFSPCISITSQHCALRKQKS